MYFPIPETPLDVCPPNAFGFTECATGHWEFTGSILTAGSHNFSGAITEPFWALGFSSLGKAYPMVVSIEQAFFMTNLQVYPSDLPQLSATKVQFNDEYNTPSGLVQTKWTVEFDHAAKTITISDLMTKLPQTGVFRACTEVLLAFWRLDSFSYATQPSEILLPYT